MGRYLTWGTTELRDAVHVHPFYENGHILGPWCWCEPCQEDEANRPMYVHRDQLERTVNGA